MGKIVIRFQWLLVTILWIYIFYRAVFVGITQDEAYSYFLVKTNYWRAMPGSLNTHWLNTLVMRLFLWLPGADYVWKIRILSVLSWWLYAFSTIRLSAVFKNKFIGTGFFLTSVLNPYLILYFSLGRGYAIACACIFLSLWQAYLTLNAREIRPADWVKVFLPASIAVLANFSSFYFLIGATTIYLLHILVSKKASLLFETSALGFKTLISGVTIFAGLSLLFIRFHTKEFDGSETADLIYSLFGSQIKYGFGLHGATYAPIPGLILFVVLMIFIVFSCYLYLTSKILTIGIFSILVAAVIVLCNIIFYLFFKTPFLYGRTGLIFYVTMLPGFFGLVDEWQLKRNFLRKGLNIVVISIGFLFILNFCKRFSPHYFEEWPFQADTQKSLDYLQKISAGKVGLTLWHYTVFTHYYAKAFPDKYRFNAVMIDDRNLSNAFAFNCDYLLVTHPDPGKNALIDGWHVKWYHVATSTVILSKK